MTQLSEKNQQTMKPATQQHSHSAPKTEVSSLSAQTSKLNLSVKIPPKATGPKLDTVQMKSNPQGGAEPGQVTDADVINTVTHLVKAATVHPLGSSSANRDLRNQKANLDNNKEVRSKAADQASKNQQVIEQDKIQQKNTIERTHNPQGAGQAGRETKVDTKTDRVIKQQNVKSEAATEPKAAEASQKEVQRFKEEHSRSQSANNANVSALSTRNTSIEGEKDSLSKDLVRERASDKRQNSEPKAEVPKSEVSELQARINPEARNTESRIAEVQRQVIQTTVVASQLKHEPVSSEKEDEVHDSWVTREDRRKVLGKKRNVAKKQLAREAKRVLRKMTPLERRKAKLKREKSRRLRKRMRRTNRLLVLK